MAPGSSGIYVFVLTWATGSAAVQQVQTESSFGIEGWPIDPVAETGRKRVVRHYL